MKFWQPYLAWSAFGLIGVVFAAFSVELELISSTPGMENLSPVVLRFIAGIQPAILVLIATALGVHLADEVGFRSWLTSRSRGAPIAFPKPLLPLAGGLVLGVTAAMADTVFFRIIDGVGPIAIQPGLVERLTALTYGGISEELIMRYGLLSLLVWMPMKLMGRTRPGAITVWTMIVLVALLFGAAHLPAMAQLTTLTVPIVIRTIALNAVLAMFLGWLLWRRGLEASIMAHVAFHPGLWLGLLLLT
ncbi:MAG TPA: hypothetical protein DEO85_02550 [Maritimibacter sp.]|nr:hypothetical protein [Maritimibacter sp.]